MKRIKLSKIVLALSAIFVIAGCFGNGVETAASKDAKHILPVIPLVFLGAPTASAMNSSDTATISVTFVNAVDPNLSAVDIGFVQTGTASCTIGVTNLSDTSARISLSSCLGDGTFRVYVKENVIVSSTNTPNDATGNSTGITIDNTGPSIVSVTPATGPVATIPSTVIVTFSEAVDASDIVSGLFASTGSTCATPATPTPVLNGSNTIATVTLAGAVCTDGQTNVVSINMALVADSLGNVGSGTTTRTYTFTDGPTVGWDPAWSLTEVSSSSSATTIDADFQAGNANVTIPTINGTSVGFNRTGDAMCNTVTGAGVTVNGATLQVSGCTGNGTVEAFIEAGILETAAGIPNVDSAASPTFTVDNAGPLLTSLTPASSTVGSYPTVQATYNDNMDTATVTSADVVISGTCSVAPTVNTITPNGTNTVYDITFTGGSCLDGEVLTISMNGNTSSDSVGNVGSNSLLSRSYTFDLTGPAITLFTPASATVNTMPSQLQATFNQALSTGTMTAGDFAQSGSCATPPTVGAPSFTVGNTVATSTLSGGSCNNGQTLTYTLNPAGVTDTVGNAGVGGAVVRTFTFDTVGPTVTVSGVNATNAVVTATFDEPVTGMTIGDFAISGCTVDPVATAFTPNGTLDSFTITLDDSGATCLSAEVLTVTVNGMTGVTDDVGNAGLNTDSDSFVIP